MSEIVVQRRHNLRLAGAKRLAETMARRLQGDYGGTYKWEGNTLHFQRTGASGHVVVSKANFEIRVEIGLLLTPLRSRIEREILAFCDAHFGQVERA
jgi:putative polyhydroxyalkanoate system protein